MIARSPALLGAVLGTGCSLQFPQTKGGPPLSDIVVYHRAEAERADRLSVEVKRLQADLLRAEEALVEVESGLRGNHTRANAVSELAAALFFVYRARRIAELGLIEAKTVRSQSDTY